jgi:rubrerythrin
MVPSGKEDLMQLQTFDDYKDALKLAIQREEDAMHFYEKMAERAHQAEQKSLLKRLSIEEKGHKKILEAFATDITTPPQGAFTPPEYSFDDLEAKDLTTEKIFQLAIRKEEESLNFYARFLVYFFKTGHEEVFKRIFEVELKHKEHLESNLKDFVEKGGKKTIKVQ